MSRLPSRLQPAWALFKWMHRTATFATGLVTRRTSRVFAGRELPRRAALTSHRLAARETSTVTIHWGRDGERLVRTPPLGHPEEHWRFTDAAEYDVPRQYTLELARGAVAGDWGAVISSEGSLDLETSEYFGINSWREHPVYLAGRLPPVESVDGAAVALTTRGGNRNYYHFLLDVLPRWGVFNECVPDHRPDAVVVPRQTRYQEELLAMLDLRDIRVIPVAPARTVRADRLYVPCLQNPHERAPASTIDWVRRTFAPRPSSALPQRIYVTRTGGPNTRRLVQEESVWEMLRRRGFVRIDPGTLSVRDQIDHFASAEVIVGLHGAGLTNLAFASSGVRILEMFSHRYVKPCFWAISENIPGARYEYLVDGHTGQHGRDQSMNGIQADISLEAQDVADALDRLESR